MKISFKAILALTALAVNTPASMSAQTQIEIRHYQAAAGNDAVAGGHKRRSDAL